MRALATACMLAITVAFGLPGASAHGSGVPAPSTSERSVYLVSHGWHVGLVLRREDVPAGLWPERDALGPVRYLEVGWGDGDFYPARPGTVALALRAAFCSRSSVLQVVGFDDPVAAMFPGSTILEADLSPRGLAALASYIGMTYARDQDGHPVVVAPALYGVGAFYAARGHYRLLDGSNTWVARGLHVAGCPVDVDRAVTAGGILYQAVAFSRVIRGGGLVRGSEPIPMACR